MSKNYELGFNCDLMLFGRGLIEEVSTDGSKTYTPLKEQSTAALKEDSFGKLILNIFNKS